MIQLNIHHQTLEVMCPMSGKPLRIKELTNVKFTLLPDDEQVAVTSLASKRQRYMCPVTRDALTNTTPCAVLKTS